MIPTPRELQPCDDCGQPVLWTVTVAGRSLLVDGAPTEDGNQACYRAGPRTWKSRSLDAAGALPPAAWEHRFRPHVASCARRRPVQEVLPEPGNVVPMRRRRGPGSGS